MSRTDQKAESKPNLKLVVDNTLCIGGVDIEIEKDPQQPLQAGEIRLCDEDTWEILCADPDWHEVNEHPIRLMTALIDQEPQPIGTVLIGPKVWRLVVYDLEAEPICRVEWIAKAIDNMFQKVQDKQITAIRLPLPGTRHGKITWRQSLQPVIDWLQTHHTSYPGKITFVAPVEWRDELETELRRIAQA